MFMQGNSDKLGGWLGRKREAESSVVGVDWMRVMIDSSREWMLVVGRMGQLLEINPALAQALGATVAEMGGQELVGLVHPGEVPALRGWLEQVRGQGDAGELTVRFRKRGGGWVHVLLRGKGLLDGRILVQGQDMTQVRQLQANLARSERRLRDFAANSVDWLWEADERGNFTYLSPVVTEVMGFTPEELVGHSLVRVLLGDGENSHLRDLVENRIERRMGFQNLEFWTRTKNGERICLRFAGVLVADGPSAGGYGGEGAAAGGYRGVASNITASKLDRQTMDRMAASDHLTGLLNRARFKEELELSVALSRKHNSKGVLVFIDLDRFKEVNDTHGHEAGDAILCEVAKILRQQIRNTDVVARLGGDEFGIIMHAIDLSVAEEKMQGIIARVKSLVLDWQGVRLTVTMSAGMVMYPQGEAEGMAGVDSLMMSADLAMYRAKDMGRNRLFVDGKNDTRETAVSVRAQLAGLERLKECLASGNFEMHYQAIVPNSVKKRPLCEALLRIYDKDGKAVSPAVYIDAAEHFGLIQQLDLAVTRRVFETQRDMAAEGVDYDVSINLSCRSLGDPAVMAGLKAMLVETHVDPSRIVFEVTETMALHDPQQMRDIEEIAAFVQELRGMGFRFALDDFGSGFTSFRYLRLLEVDMVKIDGEYVKNIVSEGEDRLFVKHMAELCKGLGIETVAEFVEDGAISNTLRDLGIDYGQGWLFAKPQPDIRGLCSAYTGKVMGDWEGVATPVVARPVKRRGKGAGVEARG